MEVNRSEKVNGNEILDVESHFRSLIRKVEEYYIRRFQKLEYFIKRSLDITNNHRLLRVLLERIDRYKYKKPWRMDDQMNFKKKKDKIEIVADEKLVNQILPVVEQHDHYVSGTSTPFSHYSDIPSIQLDTNDILDKAIFCDDQQLQQEKFNSHSQDEQSVDVSKFFEQFERRQKTDKDALMANFAELDDDLDNPEVLFFPQSQLLDSEADFNPDVSPDPQNFQVDDENINLSEIKMSDPNDQEINFENFLSSIDPPKVQPVQERQERSERQELKLKPQSVSERVESYSFKLEECPSIYQDRSGNKLRSISKDQTDIKFNLNPTLLLKASRSRVKSTTKSKTMIQTTSSDNLNIQIRNQKRPFDYKYLKDSPGSQVLQSAIWPSSDWQSLKHRSNIYSKKSTM